MVSDPVSTLTGIPRVESGETHQQSRMTERERERDVPPLPGLKNDLKRSERWLNMGFRLRQEDCQEFKAWGAKMDQRLKMLAAKSEVLSSILRIHMVREESRLRKDSMAQTHSPT